MSKADHARITSKKRLQRRKVARPQASRPNPADMDLSALTPEDYLSDWSYDIKTIAGLVDALGGPLAFAEKMDVLPSVVRSWDVSGNIPPGWHLRLLGMAADVGKTISPAVFGFTVAFGHDVVRGLAKLMISKRLTRLAEFRGAAHV
jgi:hypothetical protein